MKRSEMLDLIEQHNEAGALEGALSEAFDRLYPRGALGVATRENPGAPWTLPETFGFPGLLQAALARLGLGLPGVIVLQRGDELVIELRLPEGVSGPVAYSPGWYWVEPE